MDTHYFDAQNRFVIDDYDSLPPFASFLPGIAGPLGIPLWAFYVNRGQAIASFGVESKDAPIMEFQPANKAYQTVPYTGFRTFIKVCDAVDGFYEPFSASARPAPTRRMAIGASEVELEEASAAHGLLVNVCYFTLPGESFAGLVRQVTVRNIAAQPISLEILDGLPIVIPYGLSNALLKNIGRTAEAWMAVFNLDTGVPFYRVQASVSDEAEVEAIEEGHFYLAFAEGADLTGSTTIVDPTLVFGANTALSYPDRFLSRTLAELRETPQVTVCRTPCGFSGASATLAPGEAVTLYAIIGHVSQVAVINRERDRLAQPTTLVAKRAEARALTQGLTDPIASQTGDPRFDAYCRQSMLDNILRGGWPVRLGGHVYHLYGRRHGDLERDYNAFLLPAEFYSQGNASYRDVNQNRRCDVLLNPAVGDSEVLAFLGLIQADGYNPLTVLGSRFAVPPERQATILHLIAQPDGVNELESLLAQPFTPGRLLKAVTDRGIGLTVAPEAFIEAVLAQADLSFEAEYGEGYWVDHWFYNLDLLSAYLAVYPEHREDLLFAKTVPYTQSPVFVQPRDRKSVLVEEGKVRQYGAVVADKEAAQLIASRTTAHNLMRTAHGHGEIFRTTVFSKLAGLALLKFATLDPQGMGIEMEAGKPGWCDALNGLPGLFGSSMSETYELLQLLDFLLAEVATDHVPGTSQVPGMSDPMFAPITLPIELADLLRQVVAQLTAYHAAFDAERDFRYWDAVASAREAYRDRVRLGFDGRTQAIDLATLAPILQAFRDKVATGIARAEALTEGVPPTYFTYEVSHYELLTDVDGQPRRDEHGRPYVRVKRLAQDALPPFLEGPMHALRTYGDAHSGTEASAGRRVSTERPAKASNSEDRSGLQRARALYDRVKASPLFDAKLGMYKTNAPLAACSREIGRLRAFTPGWLENESVFLHMAYKYLLATLRAGLRDEFFADMRRGLVPFLDPQTYGRSPLENSSFIVSSAHPDGSLHGRGFVARLTGATTEFLTMWTFMTAGPRPFFMRDGELCLAFKPTLPDWLFRVDGTLTFTFLGQCAVTYRKHQPVTEKSQVTAVTLHMADGHQLDLSGEVIGAPYAAMVRNGEIRRIEMRLESPGDI